MKYTLLIVFLTLFHPCLWAQTQGTLVGKVTDQNAMPLSGVSIHLDNTRYSTLSDERGNFQFKIPAGQYTLMISCVGFKPGIKIAKVLPDQLTESGITLVADEGQMEEVVISAVSMQTTTLTPTRVRVLDIPQSITVVGQQVMQQQAIFNLSTLARNVPGLTFTGNYSGAGSAQFFNARGFDMNDTQNYRWNGMMALNWGNHYADNIEQVEFLKGPASILFGDVAPGGVMNFVTKKPLADFSANVDFKTGSWNLLRPSVDITGPLLKNRTLRYRLNTSFEKQNSFRDHVTSSSAFAAPALSWDLSDKINLHAEAVFKHAKATDDAGLVSPDGTTQGLQALRPSLYLGEPARQFRFNDQSYFATLTYELNSSWRFKALAFYGLVAQRPFGLWFDQPDEDGAFTRRGYGFYRRAGNKTLSAELSGIFFTKNVKHNILVGLEYQTSSSRHTNGGQLDSIDVSNIFSPVRDQLVSPEPAQSPFLPYTMILERKGFHMHDQLSLFNDRLYIYGGVRASATAQGNRYLQNEAAGTPYENLPDDVVSKFTVIPRFGLIYKPISNYSVYISYSKGFEINSADIFAKNYMEYANPPSTISNQIELGAKTSFLENRLGLTLALFRINKERPYGYVYLNPEKPNFDEYNVYYEGHHRSQGVEFEIDGKLFPFISINGGIAITSTRVMYDPGYPSGNRLPNAPRFSLNYWVNYEDPKLLKGFTAGTGIFYKGKFYPGIDNNPNLLMPAAYTWDAAIGYEYRQAGIQFNMMNITNQVSYLNPWQFNLFEVKPLRQFVITLQYKFKK